MKFFDEKRPNFFHRKSHTKYYSKNINLIILLKHVKSLQLIYILYSHIYSFIKSVFLDSFFVNSGLVNQNAEF